MRIYIRFIIAAVLILSIVACNRPAEDKAAATSAQPEAPPPDTSAPAPAASQPTALVPDNPPAVERSNKAKPAPAVNPQPGKAPSVATPAPLAAAPAASNQPVPAVVPSPELVNIPAGTMLTVVMIDSLSTVTNKVGDTFTASLAEPIVINGKTAFAKGTRVRGRVETLAEPGRVQGKAEISLVLTQLSGNDKAYTVSTQPFSAQAESETKQNAVKVGGGAVLGAIVGAIAGGKKGAAIGAGVGAGAGTAAVVVAKGKQLSIDSETKVNFLLKNDVEVELTKSN